MESKLNSSPSLLGVWKPVSEPPCRLVSLAECVNLLPGSS